MNCPKCKVDQHIVAEPPYWVHTTPEDPDWKVEIECFCTECRVSFNVVHKLGEEVEVTDIEEEYKYPYSA